jgi:putative ABC transport system permease protein
MGVFFDDVRYGFRSLIKQPRATLLVIGMLSLGVAGSVTIFSVANELYLRPLPAPHGERLVDLGERAPEWSLEYASISLEDFDAWRENNATFDCMAAWRPSGRNLAVNGEALRVDTLEVTYEYFVVAGNRPVVGRVLTAADHDPTAPSTALLSYGLWKERFGQDPNVIGRSIRLDDRPHVIVGVLGPDAVFPARADFWIPLDLEHSRGNWGLAGMGRLKTGVSVAQAQADLARIHRGLIAERPANRITEPCVSSVRDRLYGDAVPVVRLLGAGVGIVLLIACCNVAGVLLARGAHRINDVAVRAALGATRGAIIRRLLSESLLLCAAGTLTGLWLGRWALHGLLVLFSERVAPWMSFSLDARIALFSAAMVMITTLVSGIVPAWRGSDMTSLPGSTRVSGARAFVGRSHHLAMKSVIVCEIALACMSLVGAGLLIRAFHRLQAVDPGFASKGVLTYQLSLPDAQYPEPERRRAFFARHVEQVGDLPGVNAVAMTTMLPLSGYNYSFLAIEEQPLGSGQHGPAVLTRVVTPGYFRTMGIRMLAGRAFAPQDLASDDERTVIVNESLAKRYWPNEDPLGKRIALGRWDNWMRIVGVARDVKQLGVDEDVRPGIYLPYSRNNTGSRMTMVVRTDGDPMALVAPIREVVRGADAGLPIYDVRTMSDRVRSHGSMWIRRAYSRLFGFFAGVSTLLSAGGIYGVVSYTINRRTREMGVRMALGARPVQIVCRVFRHGAVLTGIGMLAGLAGALTLSRFLSHFLFGVSPWDWIVYTAAALLLAAVSLFACLVPARRASRIDPMEALRCE